MDDRTARIAELARRLVAYRDRAAALADGRIPPPRTLAEAIDRDFLAFDISRTERALRAAVIAEDPDRAPAHRAGPAARDRHAAGPA
ncbi:hypothetical protein ACFQY5_32175 [Paeniroseomonas aquatica]|uniref:Uncharacterized protein n=1 Tax=Paeniroseomonas aquatica TaxID=373043 RepID=A0ABT8AAK6_9PROT|nr:hypothetical protein [Paeniroseomonas aquatica]MDN3566705.1 hypothetical protein [Paeniroseomonas aquatica]